MKILFISSDNNKTSGAFLCLVELNRSLRELYHIDTLVIIPKKGDGVQLLDKYHIPYRFVPSYSWITYNGFGLKAIAKTCFKSLMMIYNLFAIRKIRHIIRDENIDLVHTNTIFTYVGAKAAFAEHKKHIWHLRECIDRDYNSRILVGKRGYDLIAKSDVVVAVSEMVRRNYQDKFPTKKVQVIYDGVSDELYKKREIFLQERVQFTCIGGLIEHKNQKEVIHAASILKQKGYQNFHVNLVGRGPMKQELQDEISSLGLDEYITLCGTFDRIQDILEETDVVCVASKSEAFGRTTVEGMLQGCLIIGADTVDSATKELIQDKKTGFLYQSSDVGLLASVMSICLQEERQKDLQRIARNGQKRALEKYTTTVNAKNMLVLYQDILAKSIRM